MKLTILKNNKMPNETNDKKFQYHSPKRGKKAVLMHKWLLQNEYELNYGLRKIKVNADVTLSWCHWLPQFCALTLICLQKTCKCTSVWHNLLAPSLPKKQKQKKNVAAELLWWHTTILSNNKLELSVFVAVVLKFAIKIYVYAKHIYALPFT